MVWARAKCNSARHPHGPISGVDKACLEYVSLNQYAASADEPRYSCPAPSPSVIVPPSFHLFSSPLLAHFRIPLSPFCSPFRLFLSSPLIPPLLRSLFPLLVSFSPLSSLSPSLLVLLRLPFFPSPISRSVPPLSRPAQPRGGEARFCPKV